MSSSTVVSKKGQVVIPKDIRDRLNLGPGTMLNVRVDGKKVIMEPSQELPPDAFIRAGTGTTGPLLGEAKATGDKSSRLLRDLGV